tara:strand:+ start:4206 stop:5333 length:1128 start_codon:yes stop_codon:yes gene_type:complete
MKLKFLKLRFLKPKYKKILVLDNATFYRNKFSRKKDVCNTLHTRYEEFYFFILIKSIFLFLIDRKNLTILQIYIIEAIKWLNPKFVISFTDYDYFFFTLKNYFPKKKIIIFQGSYRSHITLNDQIKKLKRLNTLNKGKLKIDYFFIYGKTLKQYYQKLLKTNFKFCGSVRNNFIRKKSDKNKESLVIISHFTTHLDIYRIRYHKVIKTLKLIEKYCQLNNLKLVIFGRAKMKLQREEIEFYDSVFNKNYEYYPSLTQKFPDRESNHYSNAEKYTFFLNFTSTLGYELAAKGKRVAFIYGSLIQKQDKQLKFGYPQKIKRSGYFWTDTLKEKEIFRIVDFIRKVDEKKWKKLIKKNIRPILNFDPGNKRIKKIFKI